MIDIKTDPDGALITATPTDKISEVDIANLAEAFNDAVNTHDRIPALMIVAEKFPGYDSLNAMLAHLKLIKSRETLVPRVALVSDGVLLRSAEAIAKLFIKADIRHFVMADLEAAREWARDGEVRPDAVKILDGFPNDVLAMEITGRLHAADYEEVIDPLVAKKLERHDKLKVLLVVDKGFEGATSGAAWDDLKLGLKNFTRYSKLAVVTDLHWLRNAVRLMGPFMPAKVHTYPLINKDLAEDWIKT